MQSVDGAAEETAGSADFDGLGEKGIGRDWGKWSSARGREESCWRIAPSERKPTTSLSLLVGGLAQAQMPAFWSA